MQIVCATPQAAVQVLDILYAAQLQPVRDFAITPLLSTTPPLIFTMLVILTAAQVAKIRAVADTTITTWTPKPARRQSPCCCYGVPCAVAPFSSARERTDAIPLHFCDG